MCYPVLLLVKCENQYGFLWSTDPPGTRSVWSFKTVLLKKNERVRSRAFLVFCIILLTEHNFFFFYLTDKALSEQVEKLKELISEGVPQSGRKQKTPESPQVTTRSMGKRRRLTEDDMVETDMVSPHVSIPHESTTVLTNSLA